MGCSFWKMKIFCLSFRQQKHEIKIYIYIHTLIFHLSFEPFKFGYLYTIMESWKPIAANLGGAFFKYFSNVHPESNWEIIQIWLEHIFQLGGKKKQPPTSGWTPTHQGEDFVWAPNRKVGRSTGCQGHVMAAFVCSCSFIFLHFLLFFLFKTF